VDTLGINATSYSDTGLSAGTTFDYRVIAFNQSGEAGSSVASATTDPAPALSLTANGYRVKGRHHVGLDWSGASSVDIYRDGSDIASGVSGSSYDDNIGSKGGATYQHYVCEAGSPSSCSNTTATVF
jgi:hypothetical protein